MYKILLIIIVSPGDLLISLTLNFRQEIDRMQRVIKMVHTNLIDLKLAIEGTIVMSEYLRESLDAMYDARIPSKWQKVKNFNYYVRYIKMLHVFILWTT